MRFFLRSLEFILYRFFFKLFVFKSLYYFFAYINWEAFKRRAVIKSGEVTNYDSSTARFGGVAVPIYIGHIFA